MICKACACCTAMCVMRLSSGMCMDSVSPAQLSLLSPTYPMGRRVRLCSQQRTGQLLHRCSMISKPLLLNLSSLWTLPINRTLLLALAR